MIARARRALEWAVGSPDQQPAVSPRLSLIAFLIFVPLALAETGVGIVLGRPIVAVGLLAVPVMAANREKPVVWAAAFVLTGILFRVGTAFGGPMTDQIETTQAAARGILDGLNPYGRPIAGTSTNAPFPYGPLALLAYLPGVWTEIGAATVVLLILARHRAWLTLALYAPNPLLIRTSIAGANDVLPGLLIMLAVLRARQSPRTAAVALAVATAVKPYAAAWLPGLVGLCGPECLLAFALVSAALWSPVLLVWGVPSFLSSIAMAEAQHTGSQLALDVPGLRVLAVPVAACATLLRSWRAFFWLGLVIYCIVLFLARWASLGYVLAVAPITGLVIEEWLAGRPPGQGRSSQPLPSGPAPVPAIRSHRPDSPASPAP